MSAPAWGPLTRARDPARLGTERPGDGGLTLLSEVVSHDEWWRPISDIRTLHVILSLRCNYRCEFCFQPNFHDDLPEHVWRTRLAPVYAGLRDVVLHGG